MRDRLRLTYVTDQLLPAEGTDTIQLVSMASAFGEAGAEVRLVVPTARGEAVTTARIAAHYGVEPTFETIALSGPYPAPLGFRGLEKVSHAALASLRVRTLGADLLYTRNLPVVLAALGGTSLPVVYETYRPWPSQERNKRLLFGALRRADRFAGLVLHSALAAESYRAIGYASDRLLVAHNGVDAHRFAEPVPQADARRALGLADDGRPVALYSGHISPEKGLGVILDAAQRLPRLRFVLVGSRDDGPIEQRARTLPNVSVHPWQPPAEVARWLAAADLLLIPPTRGPLEKVGNTVLPIKTFQYLASGRAVVAPATPDLAEVLADGQNARLVPPDDLTAFVKALSDLADDRAARERLGDAGRAVALANTWRARAERILAFIGERLGHAGVP